MPLTNLRIAKAVVGEWSQGLREYVVTYVATMSSALDGPVSVLNSASVPKLFFTTYQYGNDIDTGAICVAISTPRRDANNKHDNQWIFTATFRYDRSKTPEDLPVEIRQFFIQSQEPITRAQFNGFFQYIGSSQQWTEVSKTNPKLIKTTTKGVITNSAGVAILPTPERRVSKSGYFVSWFKRTAFDFYPYLNTINSQQITLTGVDKFTNNFEFGTGSTIFNKTFAAGTLLLVDVQTEIVEIYGKNVYRYTLEFHEDDHDIYELDRGLAEVVQAGDDDGRDGTFSASDFPDGVPKLRRIEHPGGGGPITEPVLFDGTGKMIPDAEPSDAIYLRWGRYFNSDFSALPIGTTT